MNAAKRTIGDMIEQESSLFWSAAEALAQAQGDDLEAAQQMLLLAAERYVDARRDAERQVAADARRDAERRLVAFATTFAKARRTLVDRYVTIALRERKRADLAGVVLHADRSGILLDVDHGDDTEAVAFVPFANVDRITLVGYTPRGSKR